MQADFKTPEEVKRTAIVTEQKLGGRVVQVRLEITDADEILAEVAVDVGAREPVRKSFDLMARETDPLTGFMTVKGYKPACVPFLTEMKKLLQLIGLTVKG